MMTRGLPFSSGAGNEVSCTSTHTELIKCYYYGSEEGYVDANQILGIEGFNLIVVSLTGVPLIDLVQTEQLQVMIPMKTNLSPVANTFTNDLSPFPYLHIGFDDLNLRSIGTIETAPYTPIFSSAGGLYSPPCCDFKLEPVPSE